MARAPLPEYDRRVIPSAGGGVPQMSMAAPGAQALGNLAATAGNIGERFQRQADAKEREDAAAWTANTMSAAHVSWTDRIQKMQDSAPLGAPGFTGQVDSEFNEFAKDQISQAPNETSKRFLSERLAALRVSLNSHAKSFEAQQGVKARDVTWEQTIDNTVALASRDPLAGLVSLQENRATLDASQHPEWSAAKKAAMTERVAVGAVQGMIERPQDLPGALKSLTDYFKPEGTQDYFVSKLTPTQAVALKNRAETEVQRLNTEGRFDILSRTKDVQAMVQSGVTPPPEVVPTEKDYTRIYGAEGPARWKLEVGNWMAVGGALQDMRTASAAERQALAERAIPKPGAGFSGDKEVGDAVLRAKTIVEQQIIADPAEYAIKTSPRVQVAAQNLFDALSPQATFSSPEVQQRAVGLALQSYALTMNAEQQRLGVDTIRDERTGNRQRAFKLLPNVQANAIVDQFNNQQTGGANSAKLVQSLEQQYGKFWPQVYGQLASNEGNKLPPAALVIPNMQKDSSRADMAAVSTMKMDDLKALVETSDPKDIKDRLLSSFGQAQASFTAQGADGNRTLATVIEQSERLALLYRSRGMSVKEAADRAYTATMGWRYQFNDTYRVPLAETPKEVISGAAYALRGVKPENVRVFTGDAAPTILTDDAIRNRSIWINNGDETGLRLMTRGPDGALYKVETTDGKPVQFDWPTLRSLAKTARTPEASRAEDIEEMRRRQRELNPKR